MEVLPIFVTIIKFLIIILGILGCITVITASIEYNQNKKKDTKKAEEARGHMNRAFGLAVGSLVVYLLFTAVGPILSFLF